MALPKLSHPTFDIKLPSNGEKIKCRPMLVKEEKLLLMAKQSGERLDQLNALKQVVTNCVVSDKFDVEKIPFVDMEYMFLKIRELSVSAIAKASFRDNGDDKVYDFDIDLSKVEVKADDQASPSVDLGDGVTVVLKYPTVEVYTTKKFFDLKEEDVFEYVLSKSIDKIFEGDKMYDMKLVSDKELKEFIESIPSKHYEKIQQFFQNAPTLYYKIEYENSNGEKRTIELKTLDDFFTFG
jgi:hypothetical protein